MLALMIVGVICVCVAVIIGFPVWMLWNYVIAAFWSVPPLSIWAAFGITLALALLRKWLFSRRKPTVVIQDAGPIYHELCPVCRIYQDDATHAELHRRLVLPDHFSRRLLP